MAIEQFLQGKSPAAIYRDMGRSKFWFFKWLHRYQSGDAEWYRDKPKTPHGHPRETPSEMQKLVRNIRIQLEEHPYAQIGTSAIKWDFKKLGITPPADRTINRILKREGLLKKKLLILPKEWNIPISQSPWDSTISTRRTFLGPDISREMAVSIRSISWISTVTVSFFIPNEPKTIKPWL